ncbi:MAG: helix-turn-helix transcriptional regulator [Terracidiphilus sp.]
MTTKHDELMLDPEFRKLYAVEGLIADTAQLIWDLLERKNMKQADLARLLNKTPAFVSQLLNGKANMTVRTLAEVVYVLGATVAIDTHDESKSACEAAEDLQMQTFQIRIPTRESVPHFHWKGPEIVQSKPRDSDIPSGVAA